MNGTPGAGEHPRFGVILPPRPEWLARRPPEAVIDPDVAIVDPHHHLWSRPGNHYGVEELLTDLGSGHSVTQTVFVEASTAYRDGGPNALKPVGETETIVRWTQETSGSPRGIAAGIIGHADLTLGDGVEPVLEAHMAAGDGRFRGVRFSTGWDPSDAVGNSTSGKRPHLLGETNVRRAASALADRGLTLDAWLFHPQLGELVDFARAVPELTIVLDHCGGPLGYGPYRDNDVANFALWREGMSAVAAMPSVVCKLGGMMSRGAAFDYLTAELPPTSEELAATWSQWIVFCIEAFGPDRCMFESNFPVEKMGVSYRTLWNTFKRLASGFTAEERDLMFRGTARRVYRL